MEARAATSANTRALWVPRWRAGPPHPFPAVTPPQWSHPTPTSQAPWTRCCFHSLSKPCCLRPSPALLTGCPTCHRNVSHPYLLPYIGFTKLSALLNQMAGVLCLAVMVLKLENVTEKSALAETPGLELQYPFSSSSCPFRIKIILYSFL